MFVADEISKFCKIKLEHHYKGQSSYTVCVKEAFVSIQSRNTWAAAGLVERKLLTSDRGAEFFIRKNEELSIIKLANQDTNVVARIYKV